MTSISFFELGVEDADKARDFYGELFGWTFEAVPGFETYPMFTPPSGAQSLGGAIGKRGEMAPEKVRDYVEVDSIEAALPRVTELGGSVIEEKREVPGMGWYAVVDDSEGNELGLWERATDR